MAVSDSDNGQSKLCAFIQKQTITINSTLFFQIEVRLQIGDVTVSKCTQIIAFSNTCWPNVPRQHWTLALMLFAMGSSFGIFSRPVRISREFHVGGNQNLSVTSRVKVWFFVRNARQFSFEEVWERVKLNEPEWQIYIRRAKFLSTGEACKTTLWPKPGLIDGIFDSCGNSVLTADLNFCIRGTPTVGMTSVLK